MHIQKFNGEYVAVVSIRNNYSSNPIVKFDQQQILIVKDNAELETIKSKPWFRIDQLFTIKEEVKL